VGRPRYLLLDEPTNGLDIAHLAGLLEVLRAHVREGGGVLLATHDLDFASALAARRVRMQAGAVVDVAGDEGARPGA
jgi:ABC-type hemin transport system ATPase subunit